MQSHLKFRNQENGIPPESQVLPFSKQKSLSVNKYLEREALSFLIVVLIFMASSQLFMYLEKYFRQLPFHTIQIFAHHFLALHFHSYFSV